MADDPRDRSRAYVAAGMLFVNDAGQVLLVQPTYKDHWDIPGGYVETGETPAQAAAREVHEELGIEATVGPLLVADWAPQPEEGDKLLFVFDGGTLTAERISAIRLQADELVFCAFRDPAEAVTVLIPRLGRRVGSGTGCSPSRPCYLPRIRGPARLAVASRLLVSSNLFRPHSGNEFRPHSPTGSREGKPAPSWTFPCPSWFGSDPRWSRNRLLRWGQINLLKTGLVSRPPRRPPAPTVDSDTR